MAVGEGRGNQVRLVVTACLGLTRWLLSSFGEQTAIDLRLRFAFLGILGRAGDLGLSSPLEVPKSA